jgi:hypothetical protein
VEGINKQENTIYIEKDMVEQTENQNREEQQQIMAVAS